MQRANVTKRTLGQSILDAVIKKKKETRLGQNLICDWNVNLSMALDRFSMNGSQ